MTASAEAVFLDTNVIVYANVAQAPLHDAALAAIQRLHRDGRELWISRQVLREYLAVMSRSQVFAAPLPASTLARRVRYFEEHFRIAEDGPEVTAELIRILQRTLVGGKQIHDANIVATMRVHGIPHLLTHNSDDFERFADLIDILSIVRGTP